MKNDLMLWAWWAWEPIYFYRRAGNVPGAYGIPPDKLEEWYESIHKEETVASMAALGINCAVTHFYKGFGLEFEKQEMNRTAEFVKIWHKYGIKVFGYIQYGSLFKETLFKEVPDAENWVQLDESMSPRTWLGVDYRLMPCINRGYLDYLKKVMNHGITIIGLDGLHFDNFSSPPCYCETCRKKFREYFKINHMKFGIAAFDNADIPGEKLLSSHSIDKAPLVEAWMIFRQETMEHLIIDIKEYAQSLKKDIMLLYNARIIHGLDDMGLQRSLNMWKIGSNAQFMWTEGGNFPGIRKNCLVHQINYFKTAESLGCRMLSTTWKAGVEGLGLPDSPVDISLNTAESAIFGAEPGTNWLLRPTASGNFLGTEKKAMVEVLQKYLCFIKNNQDLYIDSSSCADLALYLSAAVLRHNYSNTYGKFLTVQQILIQNQLPFDILFSEQENKIFNYSTIIIPETVALSIEETDRLNRFMDGGGKILIIGNPDMEKSESASCYIPKSDWIGNVSGGYGTYVYLPPDTVDFTRHLRKLIGEKGLFTTNAPNTTVTEFRRASKGEYLLHLLNYRNTENIQGIVIQINTRCLMVNINAEFLNPDIPGKIILTGALLENQICYTLPEFKTYGILILRERANV